MAIQTGIRGQKKFVVNEDMIASRLGSGLVNVFGTPAMIAAIENTAAMSVQPLLEEGKTTVGISLNVSHVAATPLGMEVRVETELTELAPNGKVMTFKTACYDEAGLIGEGTHMRAIVDLVRFEEKKKKKKAKILHRGIVPTMK